MWPWCLCNLIVVLVFAVLAILGNGINGVLIILLTLCLEIYDTL